MQEENKSVPAVVRHIAVAELFGSADEDAINRLLKEIESWARSIVPDAGTAKGRAAIKSIAAEVASSKVILDEKGKDYVADLKAQAGEVDKRRRLIRNRLDALKAEVREPVTAYENAQKALQERIDSLSQMPPEGPLTTLEMVEARIAEIEGTQIGEDYKGREKEAETARAATLYALGKRAELLRANAEAEAKRKEDAARNERRMQLKREAAAATKAKEAAEREAEEKAAAAKARHEKEVYEARRREKQAKLALEETRRKAEQAAENAVAEERARIEQEAADKLAAEKARAADREHRGKINREALSGLTAAGLSDSDGKKIVEAIAKGQIPHVAIAY